MTSTATQSGLVTLTFDLCTSKWGHWSRVSWASFLPIFSLLCPSTLDLRSCTTLVYQSLSGHALGYLVGNCQLVTDVRVRQLRSADTRTLAVNRTSSSFGDRTFAAAGTRVWNSLPPDLRQPRLSYGQFRRSLKTFYLDSETTTRCKLF